ncbi:MAG: flagellar filament capping protein FliD [Gemmatirosa sp.]
MADPLSSFTGVASGIDYRTLVDQLIALDRRPADRMQATIAANTKRKDAFNQFQTLLTTLRTSAESLKTGAPLDTFSAVVQGNGTAGRALVAATTGEGAVPGSFSLEVKARATAQKTVGTVGFGAAALGLTGEFTLTPNGGTAQTVTLDGTETLSGVRDKINALTAQTGLQAAIISGGASDSRLVLTGTKTGEMGRVALDDVAPASIVDALGIRTPQTTANDSELLIDGQITVRRSSNTVSDAIPGVTLALLEAEPGRTVTLNVTRQASAATDAAKKFVEAYNAVQNFVKAQTGQGGALLGDSLVRGVHSQLAQIGVGAGANTLPGDMTSLGALGFSVAKDGTLSLDTAKFDAAASSRLGDLKAVLADRMGAFSTYIDPLSQTGGTLDTREQNLETSNGSLTARITEIDGRLEKKRAAMLVQWSRFESTLGKLNAIGDQIGAQLKGLTKSSDE